MFEVYTAEDIILQKLVWYNSANRISERQWLDILGVLKLQAGKLDQTYLSYWATQLSLSELLQQAQSEAGL